MTPASSFLTTYAAIRFSTGNKSPGVIMPLVKAFVLITVIMIYLPVVFVIWLFRQFTITTDSTPEDTRPTTHRGYPSKFQDHIDNLTEEMK